MSRVGSGTAWLPDAGPMRAFMLMGGDWHVMIHGNAFFGYDYQAGDRGDDQLVSQNWLMAMAQRPLGGGHFTTRAMLSFEPLTVGKDGYPMLLQVGEAVDGARLVDRQHPHDLIMELAAMYERDLTGGSSYGTRYPLGVMAYVQLQPQQMAHRSTPRSHATGQHTAQSEPAQ